MDNLFAKKCIPCEGGVEPLSGEVVQKYLPQLKNGWEVVDNKKIKYQFEFGSFKEAMIFVARVGEIAEEEGHHPDIHIYYNKVEIWLWTHSIGGLSENDFIIAAKIESLL